MRRNASFALAALCLSLAAPPARAEDGCLEGCARTLRRVTGLVEIDGEKAPALLGAKEGEIALFAYREGAYKPVPFQLDEKDAEGRWILPEGEEGARSEDGGKLGAKDVLALEARSAGDRAPPEADLAARLGPGCRKAAEIEVRHPKNGGRAWVYGGLFEGDAPRSSADEVVYNSKDQSVQAREYKLRFDPKIPVGWDVLHFKEEDGTWTPNVLDRVKISILASLLWGLMDVERTEEEIHLRVLAWKDGPVRAVRRQATSMEMGLGLRSPETVADLSFLGDGIDQPIRIDLPFDPGGFFKDISWFIGLDFRGYEGAEWVVPHSKVPFKVDGKMDETEQALSHEDTEWMIIRHKRRAMIQRFKIEGNVPLTREVTWIDDAEGDRPPEYFKGQIPRAGYKLTGWERIKAGRYYTRIQTLKIPDYTPGHDGDYVELLDVRLEARETAPRAPAAAATTPLADAVPAAAAP